MNENQQRRRQAIENGELYYVSTKRCRYGHLPKRYSRSGQCVECVAANTVLYKLRHAEVPNVREVLRLNADWSVDIVTGAN